MGIILRGGLTQVKLIRTNAFAYYMFHMHVSYKFYYNNNREKLPKETFRIEVQWIGQSQRKCGHLTK